MDTNPISENEEFEFRARAEKEAQTQKKPPSLFSKGMAYAESLPR